MPRQITGVQVTNNGDGTVTIQVGQTGHTRRIDDLLDRTLFDADFLRHMLRIAYLRGNFTTPGQAIAAVNNAGAGIETRFGNVLITEVYLDSPGVHMVMFSVTNGLFAGQTHGVPITAQDLRTDFQDETVLIPQILGFMRKNGFNSLTAAARTAIAGATFWI